MKTGIAIVIGAALIAGSIIVAGYLAAPMRVAERCEMLADRYTGADADDFRKNRSRLSLCYHRGPG